MCDFIEGIFNLLQDTRLPCIIIRNVLGLLSVCYKVILSHVTL